MNKKSLGIIETVVGLGVGLWVYARVTGAMGQMSSWGPPFSSYETATLVGGGVAMLLVILGLINLTKKEKPTV